MMKILRAVQIIKRDGIHSVSSTYNELDDQGNVVKMNVKDSFMAIDPTLQSHIEAIETYIQEHRLTEV